MCDRCKSSQHQIVFYNAGENVCIDCFLRERQEAKERDKR